MTNKLIGRDSEKSYFKRPYNRKSADFIAVYGRRRVGKTYLVRNFFKNQDCVYFEATGLKDGSLDKQLKLFTEKISETFYEGLPFQTPENWLEAFKLLTGIIDKISEKTKVVVFMDEVPWFATQKSGFIQALDYYWNSKWSSRANFKLIVCGSAASCMLDNLIHAKGGLHNRLTAVIHLRPFSLKETKEYLLSKNVNFSNRQITDLYMAVGGIPHYLNNIQSGFSVAQNINQLCFQKDGFLFGEFSSLFSSLFDESETHNELIRIIAKKRYGISREEILQESKLSSSGGTFKRRLSELAEAGFIASFTPYGNLTKGTFFIVIDEYVLFYLKWIEPASKRLKASLKNEFYWESKMQSQSWKSWAGYAFESLCLKHIEQIKHALGISVIASEIGSWRYVPKNSVEDGCQIDLLINRADGIINLCAMKYQQGKLILTKNDAAELSRKVSTYQTYGRINKPIYITLITPDGLQPNSYSNSTVTNDITIDDLFVL